MKRKEWRIIPLLLAVTIIFSAFGCGKKDDDTSANSTYINDQGEFEQYTFVGFSGDKPYNPARDDIVHGKDDTTASKNENLETEKPGENVTEPSAAPTKPETPEVPADPTAGSTTDPVTESTTAKKLTAREIAKLLTKILNEGFNGTEEDAIKMIEKEIGRELTSNEKQLVYIAYKALHQSTAPDEPLDPDAGM